MIFRRTLKEDKKSESETAVSEIRKISKQIKKLKLANKQADIQAFLLPLHSKPPFPKQRFRKITSRRNCKIIEI